MLRRGWRVQKSTQQIAVSTQPPNIFADVKLQCEQMKTSIYRNGRNGRKGRDQ